MAKNDTTPKRDLRDWMGPPVSIEDNDRRSVDDAPKSIDEGPRTVKPGVGSQAEGQVSRG
ncbi:MAG TPA: hypothetical protein VGF97_09190 [Rhizomicrobium sp.]|jgi:hypothetical protein